MTVEDVRTCEATLQSIEIVVLRTARTPAEAVAATLLFLNAREVVVGDALEIVKTAGKMPNET